MMQKNQKIHLATFRFNTGETELSEVDFLMILATVMDWR